MVFGSFICGFEQWLKTLFVDSEAEKAEPATSSESTASEQAESSGDVEPASTEEAQQPTVVVQSVESQVPSVPEVEVAPETNGVVANEDLKKDSNEAAVNGRDDDAVAHPVADASLSATLPVNGVVQDEPVPVSELVNGTAEDHDKVKSPPVLEEIPSKPPTSSPVPAPAVSET
jgi:hypothetical protein